MVGEDGMGWWVGVVVWCLVWREIDAEGGVGKKKKKTCSLSASLLGVGISTTTGLQRQNQPRVGCVCVWVVKKKVDIGAKRLRQCPITK